MRFASVAEAKHHISALINARRHDDAERLAEEVEESLEYEQAVAFGEWRQGLGC